MEDEFELPPSLAELVNARNAVREHYQNCLAELGSEVRLQFTLDGNLVGDLGEAIAAELYGIRLVETASYVGIDGYTAKGKTVQVKATGTGRGAAFRKTETAADYFLFFDLDFDMRRGKVLYNGPERPIRALLPEKFSGQRTISRNEIVAADALVALEDRLPRVDATLD